VLAFLALALFRLSVPACPIFDEVYHVRAGMELAQGRFYTEASHPPLSRWITAASATWLDARLVPSAWPWDEANAAAIYPAASVFAWRLPSVLAGALALVVMAALAHRITRASAATVGAVALLALDGLFLAQSRVAMTNIYEVLFLLVAAWGVTWHLDTRRRLPLALAGAGFGLSIASRWSGLFAWGATWVFLLAWCWHGARGPGRVGGVLRYGGLLALTLGLVPLLVYVSTYLPFLAIGPGTWTHKVVDPQWWLQVVWQHQSFMLGTHATYADPHQWSSPWWRWPLGGVPVFYHMTVFQQDARTLCQVVWNVGNHVVWWASVPALLHASWFSLRRGEPGLSLVALLGFSMWLGWAVQPRALTFQHYFLPVVSMACLALAVLAARAWERGGLGRRALVVTGMVAVLLDAWLFLPFHLAQPMPWHTMMQLTGSQLSERLETRPQRDARPAP
jgi:dolichyl-phosphate-mannose--protein O-mannosyl transferase